jgi:hypothetical protein
MEGLVQFAACRLAGIQEYPVAEVAAAAAAAAAVEPVQPTGPEGRCPEAVLEQT